MSSLTTAIDILHCFSPETPELRVSDVARRVAIPKSTVSRLLKEMLHHGLVEQDSRSRRYRPGPLAFRLGTLYQAHLQILDLVDAAVEDLVEEFGLTGYVGILDESEVVILRVRQGTYPVRFVLEAGFRGPAFATAIGKALLARLDDGTLNRILPPVLVHGTTKLSLPRQELLDELDETRHQGWTESVERIVFGFGAVGAAVGTADGRQSLAFCLSYPTNAHFEEQRDVMVDRILQCARAIGQKCGDPFWMRGRSGGKRTITKADGVREGLIAV
ncbi:MAG: IclR family transcriptional regulator [Hyphomicrobiales bacterium]|nr:IclR family transcriptional regulator [Hyphomicrobiales bacterium]MCP5374178.1 IclR family transcriptional regulator [Hyphomicrobiales bacterium]